MYIVLYQHRLEIPYSGTELVNTYATFSNKEHAYEEYHNLKANSSYLGVKIARLLEVE